MATETAAGGYTLPQRDDPDMALLAALRDAPRGGLSAPELATRIGRSRSWTFGRLRMHAKTGRAVQVGHGRWAGGRGHKR